MDEGPRVRRAMAVSHAQSHEVVSLGGSVDSLYQHRRADEPETFGSASLVANTLPLTAFVDDIIMSFLLSKMFESEDRYSSKCGLPTEWLPELVKAPQKPYYKSWQALAAIIYGKAHGSFNMINHAIQLYSQAVSDLRQKLPNLHRHSSDGALASVTALYMYEVS